MFQTNKQIRKLIVRDLLLSLGSPGLLYIYIHFKSKLDVFQHEQVSGEGGSWMFQSTVWAYKEGDSDFEYAAEYRWSTQVVWYKLPCNYVYLKQDKKLYNNWKK